MNQPSALIVDDEPDIRELIEITLSRMDVETVAVESIDQAFAALKRGSFDLCLTDMRLPDGSGIDLIRFINDYAPSMPVAMITAHGNMSSAIEALKSGAFDFVSKPVDLQVLRKLVTTALKLRDRRTTPNRRLIGRSSAMQRTRATIVKLARSQAPVFIGGESGTGKELVARLIHDQGPRADGPFIPVNCGAIPEDLMESELFGHRKGSFTGAVAEKSGLFLAAEGGTLFLDEVAELPMHMQVKLLRAIQERSVRPVGAEMEVPTDVRILSASHNDLRGLVDAGRFRQDLYYRLDVIEMLVPSLRERIDDLDELAEHIIDRLPGAGADPRPQLSAAALQRLRAYHFPGNVRELENILERAMTMCESGVIEADDLGIPASRATPGHRSSGPAGLASMLDDVEKKAITEALENVRWNKTAAAKQLGISFGALRYRMQKLGLE